MPPVFRILTFLFSYLPSAFLPHDRTGPPPSPLYNSNMKMHLFTSAYVVYGAIFVLFAAGKICTYIDGTLGNKCEGDLACDNTDTTKIGCGSCIGDSACENLDTIATVVGENSCVGVQACFQILANVVGDNSW